MKKIIFWLVLTLVVLFLFGCCSSGNCFELPENHLNLGISMNNHQHQFYTGIASSSAIYVNHNIVIPLNDDNRFILIENEVYTSLDVYYQETGIFSRINLQLW